MIKDYVVFNLKQHVCVHKTSIKRNNDIFRVLKAKTITLVVTKKKEQYINIKAKNYRSFCLKKTYYKVCRGNRTKTLSF
jgi:hypothetical protein